MEELLKDLGVELGNRKVTVSSQYKTGEGWTITAEVKAGKESKQYTLAKLQ